MLFIINIGDVSRVINSNRLELLSNPTKSIQLPMELAITADALVKAKTYNVEGDRSLALSHMNRSFLSFFATTVHYPNTAVMQFGYKLSGGNQRLYQQLYHYALSCAKSAYD